MDGGNVFMKRDITKTMASLQDDMASLAEIHFAALNDLSREEQNVVASGWARIPVDKRQKLLTVLDELANDDFQMDFAALFRIALKDTDAEVRRLAVEGLWMDEKPTIIRPLLMMVVQDESAEVRASAADMLGSWVLMGEYEDLHSERAIEIVETLIRTVSNTAEILTVRARALESLGYSHDERIPALIERVYKAPDPQARRSALKAMGRHGDERWATTIRTELNNDDPTFRFEAARAAGEMADRGATSRLIMLVQDSDREVREMAVWALGEVGGKQAETTLKRLAKGEDPALRKLAREALTELKMLEDADDMSGLTLFNFGQEGEELDDEELEYADDDDFRSLMLDANWEAALAEDLDDDEEFDTDIEFDSNGWDEEELDEEDDDEWMSDEYADLRAEIEMIHGSGDDEFPFDDDEEDDLSFLEDDEEDSDK
jgi:HEAT repeat protein